MRTNYETAFSKPLQGPDKAERFVRSKACPCAAHALCVEQHGPQGAQQHEECIEVKRWWLCRFNDEQG